jgi:hypothetical protein
MTTVIRGWYPGRLVMVMSPSPEWVSALPAGSEAEAFSDQEGRYRRKICYHSARAYRKMFRGKFQIFWCKGRHFQVAPVPVTYT